MSMTDWAKKEIELACLRENPNWDKKEFDYGCACYQSALKAYESLMSDGHSGASFGFTTNILMRLMKQLPLVPITDDDFPQECSIGSMSDNMKDCIQCPRKYSLFKDIGADGSFHYTDNDRYYCIDIHNPNATFRSRLICDVIDNMFPITMPYYPSIEQYKVYTESFLVDSRNGDFDTVGILYCITPDYKRVEINKFFTEINGQMTEISKEKYENLLSKKISKFKDEK